MVNACLLEEGGKQNRYYVPRIFSTIQFLSLHHPLGFYFCCYSNQEIPEKGFALGFFPPQQMSIAVSLRSPEGTSKRVHDHLSFASLSALHYIDIRLPAQFIKCSSLEEYSKENKIFNLFSAFNFCEDWSFGTQHENSNLTLGWTPAEYQVWGEETARNEVTCRIPEELELWNGHSIHHQQSWWK